MGGVAKFYNNTTESFSTAGSTVDLNSTDINTIGSFVSLSSNGIVLEPGVYSLEGNVGGFSSSGNGRVICGFYNNSTSNYVGQGGSSISGDGQNKNGIANNPATAIIEVTSTTTFYLKAPVVSNVTSISGASDYSVLDLGRAWVRVQKFE